MLSVFYLLQQNHKDPIFIRKINLCYNIVRWGDGLDKKIEVLLKVAKAFNEAEITWNLGGSMMLFFRAITQAYNDIDIMISEKDVKRVKEIMSDIATTRIKTTDEMYKTKSFLEYEVDGINVDVIAGLTIVSEKTEHYFPLKDKNLLDIIDINGTLIYLEGLSVWLNYYRLMKRTDKVEMIEHYLKLKSS